MKILVSFTVDVEVLDDSNPTQSQILNAVEEAVTNAIGEAQGNGHNHQLNHQIAILMDSKVHAKPE